MERDQCGYSYLSDAFVAQNFDFYGKTLSGRKENANGVGNAVGTVNGVLGGRGPNVYREIFSGCS